MKKLISFIVVFISSILLIILSIFARFTNIDKTGMRIFIMYSKEYIPLLLIFTISYTIFKFSE